MKKKKYFRSDLFRLLIKNKLFKTGTEEKEKRDLFFIIRDLIDDFDIAMFVSNIPNVK